MATKVSTARVAEDRKTLAALEGISDYTPRNSELTSEALRVLDGQVNTKANRVTQLRAELAGAIDDYHTTATKFSNNMTSARDEVQAQYGRDSNELQAVGRTKSSERKSPVRKPKP